MRNGTRASTGETSDDNGGRTHSRPARHPYQGGHQTNPSGQFQYARPHDQPGTSLPPNTDFILEVASEANESPDSVGQSMIEDSSVSVTLTALRQVLPVFVTSVVYDISCPAPVTPSLKVASNTGGECANAGVSLDGEVCIMSTVRWSLRDHRWEQRTRTRVGVVHIQYRYNRHMGTSTR